MQVSERAAEEKKREQAGLQKERLLLEKKAKKRQAEADKKVGGLWGWLGVISRVGAQRWGYAGLGALDWSRSAAHLPGVDKKANCCSAIRHCARSPAAEPRGLQGAR